MDRETAIQILERVRDGCDPETGEVLDADHPYQRAELEYAMNKVGCRAVIAATSFKASEYVVMLQDLREAGKLPTVEHFVQIGEPAADGFIPFADVAGPDHHVALFEFLDLGMCGYVANDIDIEILQDLDAGQDQRDFVSFDRHVRSLIRNSARCD